ncbi:MAG: hypothetical protein L0387_30130 [Acidobacteria bacterium]|nr:hypothetical protein [Acidobacteriota bacterium]MCI0722481.1 hypothetical protein [Acidobacteriota bacterium]
MPYFRKKWTPHEADEWTKEDYWAMFFSAWSYVLLMLGLAFCFLYPWLGIGITGLGCVCVWLMFTIIDPKLRTISEDYESKQKEYLLELDRNMKWGH